MIRRIYIEKQAIDSFELLGEVSAHEREREGPMAGVTIKACTDIHISKIIKMISNSSQCLLWRLGLGVGGVSVSCAGLGQTRSWHSGGQNSLILSEISLAFM